jgi:hypothetical protein
MSPSVFKDALFARRCDEAKSLILALPTSLKTQPGPWRQWSDHYSLLCVVEYLPAPPMLFENDPRYAVAVGLNHTNRHRACVMNIAMLPSEHVSQVWEGTFLLCRQPQVTE